MSDREAFIDWWESRHYDDEDREVKKAAWCAWQAAREQERGEAADWKNRETDTHAGWLNELLTLADHHENIPRFARDAMRTIAWGLAVSCPPQSQGVPEGYVLAPKSMCITQDDVGLIVMMTGWDDEDQDDTEGVLWFGLIEDDEGNRTHGLNISCSECMEEGAIQLVQFDEPNSTPAAPQADSFQNRVAPWMQECFGPEISADRTERNHRFLEEALELVQSLGCTSDEAHQLVDYVFGREVGEPFQEVGGVRVTLAALCLANNLDQDDCAELELARITQPQTVKKIREKQKRKPSMSPLPGVYPERPKQSEQDGGV